MKVTTDRHISADSDAPKTISEQAYRMIRSDIVWGKLAPGMPLRSDDLRHRYDIGISPLREALSRLATERLVTSAGQRGFRVAPIDAATIADVCETRLIIECAALRRSVENGDVDWETRVVAAHHALSRVAVPQAQGPEAELWTARHRAFHMALLSACGSEWLIYLSELLFDQAERFRIARALASSPGTEARDPTREHQAILDAILKRDVDGAEAALRAHYNTTTELALAAVK